MKYQLYCIFEKPCDRVVRLPTRLTQSQIHLTERQGLCAAFSEISLAAAVRDTAEFMNYHNVIESVFDQVTLVPFRFGTVLDEKADIDRLLENRNAQYREILRNLEGCVEIGIRAMIAENGVPAERNDSTTEFPSQDRPNPGTRYLALRKAHFDSETSQTEVNNCVIERCRAAFAGMFRAFKNEISRLGSEREQRGACLLSLYFLVPRESLDSFRREFAALASERSSKLLFIGPWPPYNFVLPGDPPTRLS